MRRILSKLISKLPRGKGGVINETGIYIRMTNYERIKNLSIEEMEEELLKIIKWANHYNVKIATTTNFLEVYLNGEIE